MGFKIKHNFDGLPDTRKARLSVRGYLMSPGREFNATETSIHVPIHTGRRIIMASEAELDYDVQSSVLPVTQPTDKQ